MKAHLRSSPWFVLSLLLGSATAIASLFGHQTEVFGGTSAFEAKAIVSTSELWPEGPSCDIDEDGDDQERSSQANEHDSTAALPDNALAAANTYYKGDKSFALGGGSHPSLKYSSGRAPPPVS